MYGFGYGDDGPRAAGSRTSPCSGYPHGTRYDYHSDTCCGPPARQIARSSGGGVRPVMRGFGDEEVAGGIPTWGWVLGGAAVLGAGYLMLKKR